MCALQFGSVVQGGAWTPHVVISEESNLVHASRFRDQGSGQTVWLIVNRCAVCGGGRVNLSFVYHSSYPGTRISVLISALPSIGSHRSLACT